MSKRTPHQFIAVEGNIGAGKTTFCTKYAQKYNSKLILEQFTDNPFLPFFYENPERYAFPVELFFMTERHKQLQEMLAQGELFHDAVISDYFFLKTLLFAKNNLNTEEYRLFQRLFHVLNATFKKPDLLVYLHRSVENLLRNIQKRGRAYERDIKPEYLRSLQNAYFEFFKTEKDIPIIIVDLEDVSFADDDFIFDRLTELVNQSYPIGIHRINFPEVLAGMV
ncbi:MAG: deoxynucleoside kinase [Bacteroidetes bacterium]|nr:MAG: deoxynucleoside kinase [Bacteroidota bacterium]